MEERKPLTTLGTFMVFLESEEWEDKETGFKLEKDNPFLELEILPSKLTHPFSQISESFGLIAKYISDNSLDPKYITFITFEDMAKIAKNRYGFLSFGEDRLHQDFIEGMKQVYDASKRALGGRKMGKIMVCFQTKDEFLERFL